MSVRNIVVHLITFIVGSYFVFLLFRIVTFRIITFETEYRELHERPVSILVLRILLGVFLAVVFSLVLSLFNRIVVMIFKTGGSSFKKNFLFGLAIFSTIAIVITVVLYCLVYFDIPSEIF